MSTVWTILITDDCEEDREVYREYLSGDPDRSYQFIEAGSAEAGLTLCQRQHCDAILLDFRLPDMSGLEFLDALKQQSESLLPIIMLTGQGDERVAVQAMKRGVQDYLVKQDLEPDILQATVRNVIQQTHLNHQFSQQQQQRRFAETVALRFHRSLDLEQILETAVTEVQQLLECDRVAIYQLISDCDDGSSDEALIPNLTKRYETGLSGRDRDPVQDFMSFLTQERLSSFEQKQATAIHRTSTLASISWEKKTYLLAPILFPSSAADPQFSYSQVWGLLVACQETNKRQWQPDEADFLQELARHLAVALQHSGKLIQALEALETEKQVNAVASQLVTTVSHEYRTPLAAILAAASTLKLHYSELHQSKQQQFLHLIEDKARQMSQLVDDLLVLETFEAGKVNFTPMPFEILQFISNLVEEQRQEANDTCELRFQIAGNTKGFWGDRQLLRLIMVNLLSNAIKYSPDGGAIDVLLTGNETHITIEVKDEGIGIPIEDRSQLFRAFNRGSNVGTIPGTGLGLAIANACVDLHGGEIALKSQPGEGTQFTIRLSKRSPLKSVNSVL